MMHRRTSRLFNIFRSERLLGVWVGLLLLLVPFFHPLAEANAAGRPDAGVICSSFGSADKTTKPALPDDCPMGLAGCGMVAAAFTVDVISWEPVSFPNVVTAHIQIFDLNGTEFALWSRPPGQGPPRIS